MLDGTNMPWYLCLRNYKLLKQSFLLFNINWHLALSGCYYLSIPFISWHTINIVQRLRTMSIFYQISSHICCKILYQKQGLDFLHTSGWWWYLNFSIKFHLLLVRTYSLFYFHVFFILGLNNQVQIMYSRNLACIHET